MRSPSSWFLDPFDMILFFDSFFANCYDQIFQVHLCIFIKLLNSSIGHIQCYISFIISVFFTPDLESAIAPSTYGSWKQEKVFGDHNPESRAAHFYRAGDCF